MMECAADFPLISTQELIEWAKKCHTNVSIREYYATYRTFMKHINPQCDISLVYLVKDHHCHPITDERLKIIATKANKGGVDNLWKHMSDLKLSRRHELITVLNSLEEEEELDKQNHVIVLPEDTKIERAMDLYIGRINYFVEYLHWDNTGVLDGFLDHRNNMYVLNNEYNARKSICDTLHEKYKTHECKWSNQSYTALATSLFKHMCGWLPESQYNTRTRQLLDDFYPRALQWCSTEQQPDNLVNIDISKCYPSILLNNTPPIPVYTIHDVIEPFHCHNDLNQCGEFYIDETVIKNFDSPIKIEAGFYSSNLISFLVNDLYMPTRNIKYKITTKKALNKDTFCAFFTILFPVFPESHAKMLANSFIGELGGKYSRSDHGFTCRDMDTAQCIWTSAFAEGENITIDSYKNLFRIREQTVERIFSVNTSINFFVISEAILKCLQLILDNYTKDSILYSVNIDGFFMTNPKLTYPNKKDVKFKVKNIGKAYVTESKATYFEKHYRENMDINEYKPQMGNGCIYYGEAGCGKTTKLCKMVLKAENPIVLSFTNKAVENVKERLRDICDKEDYDDDLSDKCYTFDSHFCDYHGCNIPDLEEKSIFIEEYSMVPNKWMTKLYQVFSKYSNKIYLLGDTNQCDPVDDHSQVHYNYFTSETILEVCPKRVNWSILRAVHGNVVKFFESFF